MAEKYPKDPIAVDALLQAISQVNSTPWSVELVGNDNEWLKAFAILQRDHIRSEKLGSLCQRIAFGFCKEYETFLRTVLEKSPHKEVQALACLSLAQYLSNRVQRLDLIQEQPTLAKEFEDLFGEKYLKQLQQQDRVKAIKEAETLFERSIERYGDAKVSDRTTVGQKAKSALYEIRNLFVGKQAPHIEGQDQDGKTFKLSDYRGKVVLLDFWSEG